MDFLAKIIGQKRQRVETAKESVSFEVYRLMGQKAREDARAHALSDALSDQSRINIIAEFKRQSPSKGNICETADPACIALAYQSGGAVAISVLTEEDYFGGSLEDLRAVRQTIALPVLRKDFILEDYQVFESAAAGADALLLIVAALDDLTLSRLHRIAVDELRLDALVEVHTAEEMQRALGIGAKLIGVNNRNLSTFEVSLETSALLAPMATDDALLISESGIKSAADIQYLHTLGYRGFLIGETLMRAIDPEQALKEFTQMRKEAEEGA
jgi:indole-3-glycerol phosphate synthase